MKKRQNIKKKKIKNKKIRNRLIIICFVLGILLLIIFGINNVFNNFLGIKDIYCESNTKYTYEEIINSSEVKTGDNLLYLNKNKIKNNIYKKLSYIENVKIKKKFPNKIFIETELTNVKFNIFSENKYYLISKNSKILEEREEPITEYITIIGVNFSISDLGDMIYEDPDIKNIIHEISDACESKNLNLIKSIDISDKNNIILNYDNRINILFGDYKDIEYKILTVSEIILNRINNTETGTLDTRELTETNRSYFNVEQ